MDPSEVLMLIVEASLGLAGFAGVVTAVGQRNSVHEVALQRLNLVNLLATAFGALFMSLGALALQSGHVEETIIWSLCSAIGILPMIFFATRSFVAVRRAIGTAQAVRTRTLYAINVPVIAVCGLQVWNTLVDSTFWPFFVLLITMFAIGCFSFVRLLLYLRSGPPTNDPGAP